MTTMKRSFSTLAAFALCAALPLSAFAACNECGTVTDVRTVKKEGEASGAGAVIGGIAGGVLGHQVGHGTGRDVATVAGAAGGAYAGHQVEKSAKTTTHYVVHVKTEDGQTHTFSYAQPTSYKVGDRVKIVDKKLVRN